MSAEAGMLCAVRQALRLHLVDLVFADDVKPGADGARPCKSSPSPGSEEVRKHYGALKGPCEQRRSGHAGRATNTAQA